IAVRVRIVRTRAATLAVVATGLALVGAACASSGSASSARGKLTVDTTVAPLTDIVRQVVGDRVELVGLIPEGVDGHTFEPSPATVKSLSKADVLFMDGLHLEGSTLTQAEANMARPVAKPDSPAKSIAAGAKGSEIVR